jgi:CheY-like chemotaxis protein
MTAVTTCPHCNSPYDPLAAAWCDCLVDEPTLVCPGCLRCFCDATSGYKDGFWLVAPEELWQRRSERAMAARDERGAGRGRRDGPVVLMLCVESKERLEAKRTLEPLGCDVAFAADAEECLHKARRYQPALVIADDRVDGLDDARFARALRSEEALAGTKVVILSSLYRTRSQRDEARSRLDLDEIFGRPLSATDAVRLLGRDQDPES